jgi:hypothetical protein
MSLLDRLMCSKLIVAQRYVPEGVPFPSKTGSGKKGGV